MTKPQLTTFLLGLPWPGVVEETWKILRKAKLRWSSVGMYEVLSYESTLELKDRGGKKDNFKKRERVRCLQDNVIAYQDQAWGDGQILLN